MSFDPYCAVDSKQQPITEKILKHIGFIQHGFYIEAGAYDGIFQSNTKILQDKFNWKGILIEPSPATFSQLIKNRPNNIHINQCLVDYHHTSSTISGTFDNGPMSSVNNIRNTHASMIDVPCIQLEKILDQSKVDTIDFMSLDTEGYELNVLNGMNLNKYTPRYLLIEIYDVHKDKIFDYLKHFNYEFIENITNYNHMDNPFWDGTHNDYLFKYIKKDTIPFDIVIPLGPNDLNYIHKMVNYTRQNVIGYRNIYILSCDPCVSIYGCKTIDEKIFPFNVQTIIDYLGPNARKEWNLQQLLKLYVSFIIEEILDHYLVIDADTIFLKPTTFFIDNLPLYNYSYEYNPPYFDHLRKLHPSFYNSINVSGICHHMMFQKKILIEIFKLVEEYHHEPFYVCFLKCINEKDRMYSAASEYEIYFNYIYNYHEHNIIIRALKSESANNITDDCDYVSSHWYDRKSI